MRKTAIVLAGALAFDLGVLVVGAQATETTKRPDATPAKTVWCSTGKQHEYLKHKLTEVLVSSYAIDRTNTAKGCELKLGKVIDVAGMPVCQLPSAPAPTTR